VRWAGFPNRLLVALAKYHSITLVMRFYEYIASKCVDTQTLDALTLDTFERAKRSSKGGKEGYELGREMFQSCWKANLIGFAADYSVHQVILVFSYYVYVREQQRRRRGKVVVEGDRELHGGSLAMSFIKKSTLLAISRGVGLGFASVGGAAGSMVMPGWGTLAGTNLGDGFAGTLVDEKL
jgi:hypothetical protein